jgi:cation:H+ antiporter
MIEIFLAFLVLSGGIVLILFSSKNAVIHSAKLAKLLGISPLIIGITLVSIGTDISEIFNSIISCALGHGDIDVGDSVGSDLTQITLIFGILPIICGAFYIHRKDIILLGSCEILSLIFIFTVVEKGFFTRFDGLFLVNGLILFIILIYNANKESIIQRMEYLELNILPKKKIYHLSIAVICFLGVALSSFMIVESIIIISNKIGIHEYIISFFIVSIGTSLPELSVEINALKCKEHSIAIGDILGSCIVDSTLSIGIGQLLFPQIITASLATSTVLFTMIASLIVIGIIAVRKKMDKKTSIIFIGLYLLAYILLFRL